jgi:cell division septation protein DedD
MLVAGFAASVPAQTQSSQLAARTIENARQMANSGKVLEARAAIDSLMRSIPEDSPQLPDALFARATMAASVLDANLDYEKIIRNFPSSARREQSLLRLAQRSLAAGDNGKSLEYLRSLARDFRADSAQAIAGYWTARVLLEQHDVISACAANRAAMSHATAPALRADIAAQAAGSCASVVAAASQDSIARTPTISAAVPSGSPRRTIYAVQVSAYATRADADAMSERLKRTGLDAHVDGNIKPFRVRVGHYHTYAEAATAVRELKTRKLSGFVAEMSP